MDAITRKAWQAFRDVRRRIWGASRLVLKDEAGDEVVTLGDGWVAVAIRDQDTGQPALEVNILEQSGITEAAMLSAHRLELRDYVYEKGTQELNSSYPRFWQLRCQPIGRVVVAESIAPSLGLIGGGQLGLIGGGSLGLIE